MVVVICVFLRGSLVPKGFFSTCQVRVARFYQSCFSFFFSFFFFFSFSSSFSSPTLFLAKPLCQLRIALCTAGPHPPGSENCVHGWTSFARVRSQCAPLDLDQRVRSKCAPRDLFRQGPIAVCTASDLNRQGPMAVCTAGPPSICSQNVRTYVKLNAR